MKKIKQKKRGERIKKPKYRKYRGLPTKNKIKKCN